MTNAYVVPQVGKLEPGTVLPEQPPEVETSFSTGLLEDLKARGICAACVAHIAY